MRNRQVHILIVDDSEDDRVLFTEYLSRQGFQTTTARDGREGLAKAYELRPQLILMDLWLPSMSGWDAMKLLKIDERTKHIPILVVTGHSLVRPADCDGMLIKPCQLEELHAEVTRLLATRAQDPVPRQRPDGCDRLPSY